MAKNTIALAGLTLLLIVSALTVIYSKYQTRLLLGEIQNVEKKLDHYEIEWGRLQLELTMLTEENRIEEIARNHLKMVMPERDKIIYIKP